MEAMIAVGIALLIIVVGIINNVGERNSDSKAESHEVSGEGDRKRFSNEITCSSTDKDSFVEKKNRNVISFPSILQFILITTLISISIFFFTASYQILFGNGIPINLDGYLIGSIDADVDADVRGEIETY